jgi:subtilisin family serine protease
MCAAGGYALQFPDPWDLALLRASQAGVLAVAAAGNDGPALGTVKNFAPW